MNNKIKPAVFALFLALNAAEVGAADIWRHPEIAEKGTFFSGFSAASFTLPFAGQDAAFALYPPELFLDYMLPVGLPFSAGISVKPFNQGFFGLGLRPAYHVNFNVKNLDAYLMYAVDTVITHDYLSAEFGGRVGIRWRIRSFFCLSVETAPGLKSLSIGFAVKHN